MHMENTTNTAPSVPAMCICGCGTPTNGSFARGHDARVVGRVIRGEADRRILAGHPLLLAKVDAAATRPPRKRSEKAPASVKMGRWSYPVVRVLDSQATGDWRVVYKNKQGTEVEASVPRSALTW